MRPENLRIAETAGATSGNRISAVVERIVFLGNILECVVTVEGGTFRVQLHPSESPKVGDKITLQVEPRDLVILPN